MLFLSRGLAFVATIKIVYFGEPSKKKLTILADMSLKGGGGKILVRSENVSYLVGRGKIAWNVLKYFVLNKEDHRP